MDRKKIILFVLAGIFLVSLSYRILNPFKQERVGKLTHAGKRVYVKSIIKPSASSGTKLSDGKTKVMLDLFLNPPRHKGKVIKNVFQTTDAKKASKPGNAIKKIEKEKAVSAVSKKEDYLESAKRGLSSLRAFGMYEAGDEKIIFLERGKEVLLVRKGDRINGKYLVETITEQRIILKAKQVNKPIYIDISGL